MDSVALENVELPPLPVRKSNEATTNENGTASVGARARLSFASNNSENVGNGETSAEHGVAGNIEHEDENDDSTASFSVKKDLWNTDRLIAQHMRTLSKLVEAQCTRSEKVEKARDVAQPSYSELTIAVNRYRDPVQLRSVLSIPVSLPLTVARNGGTLRTRSLDNMDKTSDEVLAYRGVCLLMSLASRFLANGLTYSMTASAHLSFPIFCLRFDRTGRCFVTGTVGALVKLFYIGAAKSNASGLRAFGYGSNDNNAILVYTLRGHAGVICDTDISSDNAFLVTASDDGDVRVGAEERGSDCSS
jgi:hypothetical protein